VKYLLLGAFSSGLLAYGFSLLYGISAMADLSGPGGLPLQVPRTNLDVVRTALELRGPTDILVMLALVTVSAGLFLQGGRCALPSVGAGRVRRRADDRYGLRQRGFEDREFCAAAAPVPLRLLAGAGRLGRDHRVVALLSLTVGNLAAITQTNVKRLLAYSSISHVGYILLGLVAALSGPDGNETGFKGIAFYLFVYAFMTTGAFAIVIMLRRQGVIGDEIDDLNGLIQRSPMAAVLLLIFMLSLAGIPPLAGFMGSTYILLSLIQTGHYYLAISAPSTSFRRCTITSASWCMPGCVIRRVN
jgi:NADH-quinone oxidoreductase subunit N